MQFQNNPVFTFLDRIEMNRKNYWITVAIQVAIVTIVMGIMYGLDLYIETITVTGWIIQLVITSWMISKRCDYIAASYEKWYIKIMFIILAVAIPIQAINFAIIIILGAFTFEKWQKKYYAKEAVKLN